MTKTRAWMTLVLSVCLCAAVSRGARAQAQMPLPYGPSIGLETARKVAATAIAEAKKGGWTMAVAVVDVAGELVYFERLDNTQFASIGVSQDKARTAVRFKRPSKAFEDALVGGRQAILGLPGVVPIDGGIPLIVDGKIIGAIGVSGGTSQQDGTCAQAAADTLGKPPVMAAPPPPAKPAPKK